MIPNLRIIDDMKYGYGSSALGGLQETLDFMKLNPID